MDQRIRTLYEDYLYVLSGFFKEERRDLLTDEFTYLARKGLTDIKALQNWVVAYGAYFDDKGIPKLVINDKLREAHTAVKTFWFESGPEFVKVISEEYKGVKISIPNQRITELSTLPIYFDTLLVEDAFHIASCNTDYDFLHADQPLNVHTYMMYCVTSFADYLCTYIFVKELLEEDLDLPIYLLCPNLNLMKGNMVADMQSKLAAGRNMSFAYTKNLTNFSFNNYDEYFAYLQSLSEAESQKVFEELKELGLVQRCMQSTTETNFGMQVNRVRNDLSYKRLLADILTINISRFSTILDIEQASAAYNSIKGSGRGEWGTIMDYTQSHQQAITSALGMSKDYAVLRTLERGSIRMLEKVEKDDLIKLRRDNVMGEVRDYFRIANVDLSTARIEDYERVCDKVHQEFYTVLLEESNRLDKDYRQIRSRLQLSHASFWSSVAITIATTVLPSMSAYNIPTTILSSIIGSKSAIDVFNSHLGRNKVINEMRTRPINVFLKLADAVPT